MSGWMISKLPHVYPQYMCNTVGFLYSYCIFQVLTITYFMLKATNTTLALSHSEGTSSADMKLDNKTIIMIVVFPLVVATPTVAAGRYHKRFEWCQLDLEGDYDFLLYCFIIALAWVILLLSLKELYRILTSVWALPPTVYEEMMQQIMSGPALYSIAAMVFFVLYDILLVYGVVRRQYYSDQEEYYVDYVVFTLQYVLGLSYALIYAMESETLQVNACPAQERPCDVCRS